MKKHEFKTALVGWPLLAGCGLVWLFCCWLVSQFDWPADVAVAAALAVVAAAVGWLIDQKA